MIALPHALPAIVAGLRLGAVYPVLGVVGSELVVSYRGLGHLLVRANNEFAIPDSFAVLAILAMMATILDLRLSPVERKLSWPTGISGQI